MDGIVCRIVPLTVWMGYVTTSTDLVFVQMERRDLLTAVTVSYSNIVNMQSFLSISKFYLYNVSL